MHAKRKMKIQYVNESHEKIGHTYIDAVIRQRKVGITEEVSGVSLADRIANEDIHRMADTSEDVTVKMKKTVLS